MRESKCMNCGANPQITYAKNGVMVMVCPHVPAHIVRTGVGMLKHLEIYCNTSDMVETNEHLPSTAIYEHPKAAKLCADAEAKRQAFGSLTRDSNVTLEALRNAVDHTVSDDKLLEYANLAIMLELPTEDLPELFTASRKLGYALGISTEAAIRALTIGVGRQSRLVLDNLGIVFKAKDAYAWFKHKFPAEDFDRVTAWKQYAMKKINEKARKLPKHGHGKRKLENLHATLENRRRNFGKKVLQQC